MLARHRRPLAAFLALAGLWLTIRSAAPPAPATVAVVVAAHDLPAGRTLTDEDLRPGARPADEVPRGRLTSATGRVLASPIRAGEPLTDARVIGPGLLAGQSAGTVAVPVRLADAAAGALVQPGDRVDVLASSGSSTIASSWSEPDLADGTDPKSTVAEDNSPGGTSPGGGLAGRGSSDGSGVERVAVGALVLAAPGSASSDELGWSGSPGAGAGAGGGAAGGLGGGTGLSGLTGGPLSGSTTGGGTAPGLIVLAVSSSEAGELAAAQAGRHIAIAVLPRR